MSGVVVLSGSLGSSAAIWDAQMPELERAFRVVRVEHPGHGGAPLADVEDVRDLARLVLDRVDAPRFCFVGLSLGGAIGMRMALDAPERLDRLVLASTAASFDEAVYRERAATVRAQGLDAVVDGVLERWFTPAFRDVRRYREMFLGTDAEGYARCCEVVATWDGRGELRAVSAPTLCIAGEEDPVTPPDALRGLVDEIPDARLVVLPRARHLVSVERAGEFNRALLEFLT